MNFKVQIALQIAKVARKESEMSCFHGGRTMV